MNTERTPEQIAAELYPKFVDEISGHRKDYNKITGLQRAAWLSRQPEVDELKRQVEDMQSRLIMAMDDVNHLEATHDAEMCAFAEWIGVRGWEYSSTNWCFWDINHELISVKTTTELLTKFRER
jgi:pyruvate carboxylase